MASYHVIRGVVKKPIIVFFCHGWVYLTPIKYLTRFKELKARDTQRHRDSLRKTDDTVAFRGVVAQLCTGAARVYIGHGDVQTGETLLVRATQLDPRGVSCHSLLVWLYRKQGRVEETLKVLDQLGQQAPVICKPSFALRRPTPSWSDLIRRKRLTATPLC
jgi:hypothetical protein